MANSFYSFDGCSFICTAWTDSKSVKLPCIPDEVSEGISANYNQQTPVGRSSPLFSYSGTNAPSISFSFMLHVDMIKGDSDHNNILNIIKRLRSTCYPEYINNESENSFGLKPPITTFVFGKMIEYRGVVKSVNIVGKKPILDINDDGSYIYSNYDVSVSMDAIPSSVLSSNDVISKGAFNLFV